MSERDTNETGATRGPTRSLNLLRLLLSSAILLGGAVVVALVLGLPVPLLSDGAAGEDPASLAGDTAAAGSPSESGDTGGVTAPASQPVPVVTARAVRGDLVMAITASGTAEAERQLEVAAAQGGTIVQLPVREGDVVAQGDLLAAVDDTELRLSLQKARESLVTAIASFTQKRAFLGAGAGESDDPLADLDNARNEFLAGNLSAEEFRVLIDDPRFDALFQTITREEVMAAQDRLMTERANFTEAELDLERARTTAPFDGQVGQLEVVVGQRINAGATVLTLVDADPVRVRVEVLESEAGLVRQGRRAEVRFAAYPGEVFEGRVEAISPVVDPEKRTLAVTVSLPNPELRLKPGMFARIQLDTDIFPDRVLVPSDAVLLRDERPMVFVVRDERAQWVYIERGRDNGAQVEVIEGVEPDDVVIVSGHYSLAHDAAVRIVEENPAQAGAGTAADGAR